MAVPGLQDWQVRILRGVGAPATPQNLTFLNAWARAEGGGATNNPFNTTQPVPGASSYNSVGVRNYGSPDVGIQATIDTLLNGRYGNIIGALKQGTDPMAAANALAASPWGTGSLVQKILGGGGAVSAPSVPSGAVPSALPSTGVPAGPAPLTPPTSQQFVLPKVSSEPDFSSAILSSLGKGPNALTSALIRTSQQPVPVPALTPLSTPTPALDSALAVPSSTVPGSTVPGTPVKDAKIGDPIPLKLQTAVGPEHETAGLAGFPAHDYMAPAGAPVVAPVGGKIIKLSGHDPSVGPTEGVHGPFGWSLYVQGTDGRTYFLTHLGSRDVQLGDSVKAGQQIGTVGNYARWGGADHVHMGVNG